MLSELLIIFLLVCLNGVFAMSEIAMISLRKGRLESAAKKGDKRAAAALELHNQPSRFLSTVQIGITLIGILLGIYSGDTLKDPIIQWLSGFDSLVNYAESIAVAIVVVVITLLSLLIGELLPKRIGLSYAEPIAKFMAGPMTLLSRVTAPFIWLLSASSNGLIKLFNLKAANDDRVTEEEIKAMIQEGTDSGEIEEIEQNIVERVFHLGDRRISSLMTHRSDIIWLDITSTEEELRSTIGSEVHSVYPVCDGDLDKAMGIVYIKHLFLADDKERYRLMRDYIKPVLFLPENNTAYSVLEKFKSSKIHYAFVVDEYGSVQGFLTINDILEAIVGEFDELNLPDYSIVQRDDQTYLLDAGLPFYDFLVYFEIEEFDNLEELEYNTVAGLIIHELERIPSEGEKLRWKEYEFEVIDMDGTRVDKLLFRKLDKSEQSL
jgi:putative hemolysin